MINEHSINSINDAARILRERFGYEKTPATDYVMAILGAYNNGARTFLNSYAGPLIKETGGNIHFIGFVTDKSNPRIPTMISAFVPVADVENRTFEPQPLPPFSIGAFLRKVNEEMVGSVTDFFTAAPQLTFRQKIAAKLHMRTAEAT